MTAFLLIHTKSWSPHLPRMSCPSPCSPPLPIPSARPLRGSDLLASLPVLLVRVQDQEIHKGGLAVVQGTQEANITSDG